jgi:RimJ/RimL family protein N-acetyltransferase
MRLETARLILREWRDEDRAPYAAFNADPEVRRYFHPELLTPEETDRDIDKMVRQFETFGYGFFPVERKSDGAFIGEVGFSLIDAPTIAAMIRPAPVEVGWFFGRDYWGQGYAHEAVRAILDWSWRETDLPEFIALICAANAASIRLAEKLRMLRDPQHDFEDPTVPVGHWQRPHVIYRIARPSPSSAAPR